MMEINKPEGWKLRICVISRQEGFCYYYRIKWPLAELERRGLVEVIGIDLTNKEFIKNPAQWFDKVIDWADIFIFQYSAPSDILTKFNDLCIKEKIPKLFISEFDDDVTQTHPSNRYYRYGGLENIKINNKWLWKDKTLCDHSNEHKDKTKEEQKEFIFDLDLNRKRVLKILRAVMYSDIITTTTKELANVFRTYNSNICVLPNYINPDVMPDGKKKKRDYILIGWQGGDSHHHDLKLIMPALKRIKDEYKDKVKFRFTGAKFTKMYKELDAEFIPWIEPDKFYDKFSEDILDIGLIPLLDPEVNKFNISKSNIKWLEYSYYGIPSVVSGCKPYIQNIENNVTGVLCHSTNDWYDSIKTLIEDPFLRFNIGANAKKEVNLKYTIQTHAHKWYDFYMAALKNKIEYINDL